MPFYQNLNHLVDQIEASLDLEIDYQALARQAGVSLPTLQKVFSLLANISLAEYVRKRRLTLAGKDLVQTNLRIIDLANKYGYDSAAAFSRAFTKFHHIKPSEVKQNSSRLTYFPKLVFSAPATVSDLEYEIIETPALHLAGLKVDTNIQDIKRDAPALFRQIAKDYPSLRHPDYGLLVYGSGRDCDENYRYYALWQVSDAKPASDSLASVNTDLSILQSHPDFATYDVPPMRWLKFRINSQDEHDIQSMSDKFYAEFLPTCNYQLRPEPELEHYHDGVTDFLVPIY